MRLDYVVSYSAGPHQNSVIQNPSSRHPYQNASLPTNILPAVEAIT